MSLSNYSLSPTHGCEQNSIYLKLKNRFFKLKKKLNFQEQPHRSMMVWKDLAAKYPMLPFIAVACTIVLAVEARFETFVSEF